MLRCLAQWGRRVVFIGKTAAKNDMMYSRIIIGMELNGVVFLTTLG